MVFPCKNGASMPDIVELVMFLVNMVNSNKNVLCLISHLATKDQKCVVF